MHDPFLMLVRFLRDSRHNGKLPVYCHCARCVVLLQLIYQLIHGLIKLRDTLNKSGFRGKKAWIYGLFSAKTTLNQCFLSSRIRRLTRGVRYQLQRGGYRLHKQSVVINPAEQPAADVEKVFTHHRPVSDIQSRQLIEDEIEIAFA